MDFEIEVINSAKHPPMIWMRYVDCTFMVLKTSDRERCLQHIYSTDPCIQLTVEDARADGSMPFLDT